MISALILAVALAPETHPGPSPGEIARMNHAFERAHQVWTVTDRGGFDLTRPHASELGLDYGQIPGHSSRRPSVVAANQDTVPAPPRPLPWARIERIEWRHGGGGTGWFVGTLTSVAILAGVVAMVNGSHSDVGPPVPNVMLGAVAGGVLAGVVASEVAAKTEVIYRAP
jgi:hypothetical protein